MSTGNIVRKDGHYAHHFESAEQEYTSSKLGIWLFLSTEILMFGGLFVAFFIYKGMYPEVFFKGAESLSWQFGAVNTVVLLASSLTMALGIHYIQKGRNEAAFWQLIITVLCGAIFMGIKYIEYSSKFEAGLFPGAMFAGDSAGIWNLPLYFSFYFMMTGLHGLHVLIGMGLITWVAIRCKRGEFGPKYYTPVEGVGLFWHVVDLIWIYLFPLLYLVE